MLNYDCIVIGSGIVGSSAAYHLARDGKNTLLLDQFPRGHARGSSGGHSRITRYSYTKEHYANMMIEAYAFWKQLEKDIGEKLFIECGMVTIAPHDSDEIKNTMKYLIEHNHSYKLMDSDQLCAEYPMLNFNDDYVGLLEKTAGVLKADKCLNAIQNKFLEFGGIFHDEEPVMSIIPGEKVTVCTTKATYNAKSIIIAAGPWTNKLLQYTHLHLPLEPQRIKVPYWKQKDNQCHDPDKFPTLFLECKPGSLFKNMYSVPVVEYPNHVKICVHNGEGINPDERDLHDNDADEQAIGKVIRDHFPGLNDKASIKEVCMYTMTPDKDFILDYHPCYRNIIIGAGFSGHGFKLGPISGKILKELALNQQPSYDINPFKISRFHSSKL